MQLFDFGLSERLFRYVDYIINGVEVVDRFDDIIDRDAFRHIDHVGFKDESCLILAEFAAFNVVGIAIKRCRKPCGINR